MNNGNHNDKDNWHKYSLFQNIQRRPFTLKIFQIYYYIIFILFNLFGVQSDLTAEGLAASSQRQGTCSAPHRRDVAFEMFVYLQVTYQGVPYYWAHFVFSYFVCFCLSFWIRGVLGLSPRRKIEKSYHTLTATKT